VGKGPKQKNQSGFFHVNAGKLSSGLPKGTKKVLSPDGGTVTQPNAKEAGIADPAT
jgi:hypothetical protein